MNTLSLSFAANSFQAGAEMSTLQFLLMLAHQNDCNEYFYLGIPFFALQYPAVWLPGGRMQCERVSSRVGGVPRHVRKVAFPASPLQGLLTLVNKLF